MYKADYEAIYKQAEDQHSWHSLIPYPYLLFRWQTQHSKDIRAIATVASHRLSKHTWCGKDCEKIDAFIKSWELGQKDLPGSTGY